MATHNVNLSWTASTDSVDGYNVYRGTSSGSETVLLNATPLPASQTTFEDQNVPAGLNEYYIVKSVSAGVESVPSNEVVIDIPAQPAPPTGLTIVSHT